MSRGRALIVDDEPDIRELLAITLGRMELECVTVASLGEARNLLRDQEFDICLTDMRLPDGNGIDLVAYIQKHGPDLPVAVITAHGNMESAIQALKAGAFDFLTKPVDLVVLRSLVGSALKLPRGARESSRRLIGESQQMRQVRATVEKLARSQAPIYISGESGTGKELVARLIHEQGPRAQQPFVPVNCGAIPQDLMESEFFGHKKGSFTGAVADKQGLFQAADGGTLFFDEIAELPPHMQVKLLRAIQEKTIRPVGAQQEIPVNVRFLCATHKDLAALVRSGQFRQDLFYRINVIEIHVPALRERVEDISLLVDYILERLAGAAGVDKPALTPQALSALQAYSFPGNVRELENILERAMTLCDGRSIQAQDLQLKTPSPAGTAGTDAGERLDHFLEEVERQRILDALEKTGGNKTAAARLLGINVGALRYRLQRLGLEQDR